MNLLEYATAGDVRTEPYPHLVLRNVLSAGTVGRLTGREPALFLRIVLNLFGELSEPLFGLERYQARSSPLARACQRQLEQARPAHARMFR